MIFVNELRHKSLPSAHVILLHDAEVNISIELGAEVNIRYRSPQLGAELTSVPKLLMSNIDRPRKESTRKKYLKMNKKNENVKKI